MVSFIIITFYYPYLSVFIIVVVSLRVIAQKTKFIVNQCCSLYTAVPAVVIELQYLNRYLNTVREFEVTTCQGMRSNLGDLPSIPSSYAYPAKIHKIFQCFDLITQL